MLKDRHAPFGLASAQHCIGQQRHDGSSAAALAAGDAAHPDLTRVTAYEGGRVQVLRLPPPNSTLLPRLNWGRFDTPFTPAFWRAQVWFEETTFSSAGAGHLTTFALGATLREELAACLLGGHGLPAEVALAAYVRVRDAGLLQADAVSQETLQRLLELPLDINGRSVRYRFPAQRSRYLSRALNDLASLSTPPSEPRALRQWLLQLPGVGYKTASWITRNHLDSDAIAILDIHIHRAGLLLGIFSPLQRLGRDYLEMECQFLLFAHALGVRAAVLDAVIWREMRLTPGKGRHAFSRKSGSSRVARPS